MAETNPLLADFVSAYDGLHPLLEAWLEFSALNHVIGPFCITVLSGFRKAWKKSQKQLKILVGTLTIFLANAPFLDLFFLCDFLRILPWQITIWKHMFLIVFQASEPNKSKDFGELSCPQFP